MNKCVAKSMVEPATLIDLVRWRALRHPNRCIYTFLVDGETEEASLTYGELDLQARAIATQLQNLKVEGERVVLLYPPGLRYIAAFFGCLYAGAIAVPTYPPRLNRADSRLQSIIADAQATVALTTTQFLSSIERRFAYIPDLKALKWLSTDDLDDDMAEEWEEPAVAGNTLALLQYTSGSTAAPKGVMVSHDNLMHNLALVHRCFEHTPDSVGVIWLPPYHDMGLIGGILEPLYGGFPVVLMSPVAFLQSPIRWLQAISHYRATTSGGPNFAYDLCVHKITLEQRSNLDLNSWDVAFNGAEPIRADTLDRFTVAFESCGFRREAFYPCYGLAEATLMVTGGEKAALPVIGKFEAVALGRKRITETLAEGDRTQTLVGCGRTLPDQEIVIADPEILISCSPDQMGEIWMSGPSITQGYWNRLKETEHTFRAYLADTGEGPFLRTGDLGFLKDGELFISGRIKDLIIIRGRNHYPQDIELSVEQSHPALQPGCGAAFSVDVDGEQRLVVVQELKRTHRNANVEEVAQMIRQAVAEEHELQVYGVVLIRPMSIPKTSSGKIQRHLCRARFLEGDLKVIGSSILTADALSDSVLSIQPEASLTHEALILSEPTAHRSRLTRYLQEQIAQALGIVSSQIDPRQPVTSLGIDSLIAVELQNRIETYLGVSIPAVNFLEGLNIEQLATRIIEQLESKEHDRPLPPIQATLRKGGLPLSFEQERLWFLDQVSAGNPAYHITVAIRFTGPLDITALEWALDEIVQRHEPLRTTFPIVDRQPVQAIAPLLALTLPVMDLRALPEAKREIEARRLATEGARRSFDLAQGPLIRASLLRLGDEEHMAVFTLHHIISDIWSVNVLLKELATLYEAFVAGRTTSFPKLAVQYADFAQWQRERLLGEHLEGALFYWKEQLANIPPALELPADRPRPMVRSFRGAYVYFEISPTLFQLLQELNHEEGATSYMTLLTAFKVLLYCCTDQEDVVIGSPTSGRVRPEINELIGLFAYPLVLRTRVSGDLTFRELLARVRQVTLGVYAHQDVPFSQVVRAVHPERNTNYTPLFQVMFGFTRSPLAGVVMPNLELNLVDVESGATDFDLFLTIVEEEERLRGVLGYNTDLFDVDTIEHLANFYCNVLEQGVQYPETRLSEIELSKALEAKVEAARARDRTHTIAITATFTVESVEESLTFWAQKLALPFKIAFAPYNQVFQQLLDPSSLLARNEDGINVVLVRFEDWQRFDGTAAQGTRTYPNDEMKVERNTQDLIGALKTATKHRATPLLVCVCPASPDVAADLNRAALFERMEKQLVSELESVSGVYVVMTTELAALYPVSQYYDSYGEEVGHIPYTPAFFTALGTMITRKVTAIRGAPYKVIVLDCDQTLWKGVCGENGPLGVEIDPPYKALQEFMVAQYNRGRLLCLCSKNNKADVFDVFDCHPGMVLKREHIVSWRVNWKPKSENIRSMAEELQLGLDSFIFLDDDRVVCAEVQANCPEVLTLQLPQEAENIPRFLSHVWAFDCVKTTEEDRQRTTFYRQKAMREHFRKETFTFDKFLAGLELEVQISELLPQHVGRVAQLTQRTNQFNCTSIRRSESEIQQFCILLGDMECLVVDVRDRFGDYGLVGVIMFETRQNALWVDTFLLSCRALGRGVEHQMLAHLREVAKVRGFDYVIVPYLPTSKNQPALDFLNSIGASFRQSSIDGWLFRFPTEVTICAHMPYLAETKAKS